jgi:hypothetical protein
LLGDLDYFKRVNDTFGHVAGDMVLREVSNRIASSIRTYDAVGRYGGEEFLIILPGCDEEAAMQAADRIRASISKTPVSIGEESMIVTASFGVTSLPKGMSSTPEALFGSPIPRCTGPRKAGGTRRSACRSTGSQHAASLRLRRISVRRYLTRQLAMQPGMSQP